jgi:hypothetical protein
MATQSNIVPRQPPERQGSHRRSPLGRRFSHDGTTRIAVRFLEDGTLDTRSGEQIGSPNIEQHALVTRHGHAEKRTHANTHISKQGRYNNTSRDNIGALTFRQDLFVRTLELQQNANVLSAMGKSNRETRRYVLVRACTDLGQRETYAKVSRETVG